ncbi:DUF1223 domain-containing protein [Jhaorihella thermophila]
MTRLVTAICAAVVALTGLARPAEANPVVVELFTSQGCSSCPPAEELLGRIADRDEVLALSLHVDYWDYLGWKDEYALKDCTRRQRGYARAAGRNMVYTPQMIVNGREALTGTDTMELAELIMKYQHPGRDAAQVEVVARRTGNALSVEVAPREGAAGKRGRSGCAVGSVCAQGQRRHNQRRKTPVVGPTITMSFATGGCWADGTARRLCVSKRT